MDLGSYVDGEALRGVVDVLVSVLHPGQAMADKVEDDRCRSGFATLAIYILPFCLE